MPSATIIGSPISPYVRKVLAACEWKGVEWKIDPIVPFFGSDEFSTISPLRRIPVYRDDLVELCDSSVICQYLEDRWPSPALYPADLATRAKARWIEEYADTRVADVFVWKLFNDSVISPAVFGSERDKALREKAIAEDLPVILDYLDSALGAEGFLAGDLGIADLSVAPHFANLGWARVRPDWGRWPRLQSWLERTVEGSALARLDRLAAELLATPIPAQRGRLEELGVAVTPTTLGVERPRKGPMSH